MNNHNQETGKKVKTREKASNKPAKRKRRINSEKHIEGRPDEIPWPPPNESAIALYNQLLNTDFKLTNFEHAAASDTNVLPKKQKQSTSCSDNDLESVHQKLDKLLLGDQSRHYGAAPPNPLINRSSPFTGPVGLGTASSQDVCTLYTNKCQITSGEKSSRPPIGVFWDIENCSVPKGRSALVAVQRIRERFFFGHYEAEFLCVCDIRKESPTVIQELNDAQVSVVHVSGNSKNAADDKLRQAMRRFSDVYSSQPIGPNSPYPATIILISGDINFSSDLSDLRHRKRLYVILLHNKHAPEALLICAHEQYEFRNMLANLPPRPMYRDFRDSADPTNEQIPLKGGLMAIDLLVADLPLVTSRTQTMIRNRLRKLSENCGGKVVQLQGNIALIRFPNKEAALRASKRMNGEDVLGSRIRVLYSSQMEFQQPQIGNAGASYSNQSRNQRESSLGPSWKPTWKNNKGSSDGANALRPVRSCLNQSAKPVHVSFQNSATPVSGSNSSSPFDSSREESPSVSKTQPLSIHPAPLNNSTQHQLQQIQAQPQAMIPALNANSAFAFHQNLFPMHHNGMSLTTQQQQVDEVQIQPQQQNSDFSTTPRLYSAPFAPVESNIPSNLNCPQVNSQTDLSGVAAGATASGIYSVSNGNVGIPSTSSNSHFMSTPSAPFQFGNSPNTAMKTKNDSDHFDLHVTNIDPLLGDWKVIRHALITAFGEHVGIKGVWVYVSQDGSVSSVVRVNNKEEAHFAVAQLHRKKIGSKRIFISFDQGGNVDQETLKKEVASLLQDVPGASLPLFKFREMFEKRYRRSVSSSDLYRLRDVVSISENSSGNCSTGTNIGRTISLSSEWKSKEDKDVSLYCSLHPPKKAGPETVRTGWAEKEAEVLLPCVVVELKVLSSRVHSMLNSHGSAVPLISFLDCYEAEFGAMERAVEGGGVPLEHLLSCVKGVEIAQADNGMKRIQKDERVEFDTGILNQPLQLQLSQFGREMVDLLKTFPRCSLAFSKLIPAYHHHFGRQCRVADYGHFNLYSLLQTLPHVVQILGAAQNRILTLSHKAQMKRFTTDLLRVLKAHGGAKKQVRVEDFPQAFTQVFTNREFHPEDYGLCHLSDLITALVESNTNLVALVKDEDGNQMLAVPKREQTPQEIHRTRIFASEVIELLRHSIRYEMPFSKFIPAYHHHFGKQCRVSDYGFSKLAELFEAINDTVVCVPPTSASSDCNTEDRLIRLIPQEQVKVVGDQLSALVEKHTESARKGVLLSELDELFINEHGFQLRPEMCDAEDMEDLVKRKLGRYVTEENGILTVVDRHEMEVLSQDAMAILEEHPDYKMELDAFLLRFSQTYKTELDEATIERHLCHALILSESDSGLKFVALTPLRVFAREISQLLEELGSGSLMLTNLETAYFTKFNRPLRPAQMGYPSVLALLEDIPDVVEVRGKHRAKKVCLVGHPSSDTSSLEDSFRSQKSRFNDSFSRDRNTPRPYSADHARSANNTRLKIDSGRWSDSPKRRRAPPPPPLFPVNVPSPSYAGRQQQESSVFTFDRTAPLSPPVYDLWMRDTMSPGTPPLSPPVVWTYHPIVYPPPVTPPATSGNILMPTHFSYSGPWSPPIPSACYDNMANQTGSVMGTEYIYEQHNRLTRGVERLGLGMDQRNEA